MPRVSKKSVVEAPTRSSHTLTPGFIAGLVGVGVLVIGSAVMIGRSDSGAINVSATITESNQVNAENGTGEQVNVGNPALQNLPNGGLVPQGTPPEQVPVVEEIPATTTDASASTTSETTVSGEESATETPPETSQSEEVPAEETPV
ncbi:hypothetical protein IPH92_03460 [Candidatus Kaiserbacteria bacterium]|nr:MAG: hypothetical protein IPH92_03460 [Candidatus Kaiserbacteria bacterium]